MAMPFMVDGDISSDSPSSALDRDDRIHITDEEAERIGNELGPLRQNKLTAGASCGTNEKIECARRRK